MITEKSIQDGLRGGYIKLIVDPNMNSGTVCQIGDNWFYFGGITAEEMSPEEYLTNVPEADIVEEIYTLLDGFARHPDFKDEYDYYDAYLAEVEQNRFANIFLNIREGKEAVKAASKASNAVNSFCFRAEKTGAEILQYPFLYEAMLPYAIAWIKQMSTLYTQNNYDGRNELACKRCSELVKTSEFINLANQYFEPKAVLFAGAMSLEHRTLQQSFAALCLFLVAHKLQNFDETNPIWQLPLI